MKNFLLSILITGLLTSCSLMPDWVGADNEKKLAGERIDVLPIKSNLMPDPSLAPVNVSLPPVAVNTLWLRENFGRTYHLALASEIDTDKIQSIGEEPEEDSQRLLTTPVIAQDILYVMDGEGVVTARELADPAKKLWEADIKSETFKEGFMGWTSGVKKAKFLGGHIAYSDGMLFVTTVAGEVIALDARRGYEIWRREFGLPIKSAPVVDGGALYFIAVNNKFYAVDAANGKTLWTHAGITETTGVLGASSPVIEGGVVLVPYSSGEIYVLNRQTGMPMWGDSLAALGQQNASLFSLNDIDATPVVYDGIVYAVGHEGVLTATELSTAKRIWEQEISSLETPWVVGDFIFLISTNDELICVYRPDGRIKWITPLPSYKDQEKHRDKIDWSGPVVAGGKVYMVNSIGELKAFSPQDGSLLSSIEVEEDILLPPIVSDKKMYLLSNDASLTILQ